MISNHWEELKMPDTVNLFHEKEMTKVGLPDWIMEIQCPFCKGELDRRSIRMLGFKLNTRNMGDIVVEFSCERCQKMDTLYYRDEIKHATGFGDFMNGTMRPKSKPLLEEDMYKMQYNNVVERMIQRGASDASDANTQTGENA